MTVMECAKQLVTVEAVTTGEFLAELSNAAQVIADHRGLPVVVVREILLTWESVRPTHP